MLPTNTGSKAECDISPTISFMSSLNLAISSKSHLICLINCSRGGWAFKSFPWINTECTGVLFSSPKREECQTNQRVSLANTFATAKTKILWSVLHWHPPPSEHPLQTHSLWLFLKTFQEFIHRVHSLPSPRNKLNQPSSWHNLFSSHWNQLQGVVSTKQETGERKSVSFLPASASRAGHCQRKFNQFHFSLWIVLPIHLCGGKETTAGMESVCVDNSC